MVHREYDDPGRWGVLGDSAHGFEAIQARHGDVHQNEVRPVLRRHVESFPAIGGLYDLSHLRHRPQEGPDRRAHQGMIIGQQHSHGY